MRLNNNFTTNKLNRFFGICLLILASYTSSYAQSYEDQDYDYEEDYNYNNDYYERYSEAEYKRRNERFYKKSYREQDLYNGGYKARSNPNDNSSTASVGGWSLLNFTKRKDNPITDDDLNNESRKFNRYEGIEKGVGEATNMNDVSINAGTSYFEPGKGAERPGREIDDKVPPPPDEPDVPITNPILTFSLFVVMVLLGVKTIHTSE
jgi:hypothetical protein